LGGGGGGELVIRMVVAHLYMYYNIIALFFIEQSGFSLPPLSNYLEKNTLANMVTINQYTRPLTYLTIEAELCKEACKKSTLLSNDRL
jgi:hypothetical protein